MPNIEIKAYYTDLAKAEKISENLNAKYFSKETQIDTYFKTKTGRLKLREIEGKSAYLIPYLRPDINSPKKSTYELLTVSNIKNTKMLLSDILGVDTIVKKIRTIYLLDNVRIHLDRVENLGTFIEFEAVYKVDTEEQAKVEKDKVYNLLDKFNIKTEDLINKSYRELIK